MSNFLIWYTTRVLQCRASTRTQHIDTTAVEKGGLQWPWWAIFTSYLLPWQSIGVSEGLGFCTMCVCDLDHWPMTLEINRLLFLDLSNHDSKFDEGEGHEWRSRLPTRVLNNVPLWPCPFTLKINRFLALCLCNKEIWCKMSMRQLPKQNMLM